MDEVKENLNLGHRARMREKVLKHGASSLADYEVVEMLLFAAHPRGDVKPLAKKLLAHFGSLSKLASASREEFAKIDGAGDAVASVFMILQSSLTRILKEEVAKKPVIGSIASLVEYCRIDMQHSPIEAFRVLFLNQKNMLLADEILHKGTVNHTQAYPREIIKRALELSSSSIILVHNHPSGDITPSAQDIDLTKFIMQAAMAVSINVYDHIIISREGHFSFKSHGLI